MEKDRKQSEAGTSLQTKIRQVLTEARMVLPGAQALLGFQVLGILTDGFDRLPLSSQYLHLVSLVMIALSTIFLMAPAAYHRIVYEGENSQSFYRVASYFVLAAMFPLALGLAGDLFVVVRAVTQSLALATIGGLVAVLVFTGLWFGFPLYWRKRSRSLASRGDSQPIIQVK